MSATNETEEEPATDESRDSTPAGYGNKTQFVIPLAFIAIAIIAALLIGSESSSTMMPAAPLDNARAVVLPPGDGARTVTVAPCATPIEETRVNAAKGEPTPGAVTIRIPEDTERRTLLVPDCNPMSNAATSTGALPAAAFVLPSGIEETTITTLAVAAKAQVIVPPGSPIRSVVISGCTGRARTTSTGEAPAPQGQRGRDAVLTPGERDRATSTAPAC